MAAGSFKVRIARYVTTSAVGERVRTNVPKSFRQRRRSI